MENSAQGSVAPVLGGVDELGLAVDGFNEQPGAVKGQAGGDHFPVGQNQVEPPVKPGAK